MRRKRRSYNDDDDAVLAPSSSLEGLLDSAKRLTPERERMLLKVYKETGDQESRRELVEANYRLVASIAKWYLRHARPSLDMDDLMVMGTVGLINGIEKFDPGKGYCLSTYVSWAIRREIMRSINKEGRMIRLPAHVVDHLKKFIRQVNLLRQVLGREPSPADIERCLGYDETTAAGFAAMTDAIESLDVLVGGSGTISQHDLIGDNPFYGIEEQSEWRETVARLISTLKPLERTIIELRYGLGSHEYARAVGEVSQLTNLTQQGVRYVERTALTKLNKFYRNNFNRQ